jgi:exopolyphosphatase / guanosine-5'-triphosphate,3'-diphosphate pyrophosphatase
LSSEPALPLSKSINQVVALNTRSKQLGALDLGSNSFHLLIAQESHGRVQVLDKHKEMVRLAEGLNDEGKLSKTVTKRALACLERFAQRLATLDQDNVRIVGTNTLRKASDRDFIVTAEQILGHKIEIISGREEARLIYMGVCHDLGGDDQRRLVADIGGGSTELILGRKNTPETLESLHMGCVSMSQQHFAKGIVTKQAMRAAMNQALLELEPIAHDYMTQGWETSVGASGTINAVREVIKQASSSDVITAEGLANLRRKLIECGDLANLQMSGLAEERKAVFPGGVAILSAVFEALHIKEMTASQGALREGLIYDLLGRQHEDDARDHTVRGLMVRYRIDEFQAKQVRETALSLLSQVAMDWSLTESSHKQSIAWAANLHEIGMDISHSGFHKHGGYLLENMDLPGFSRSEQTELAVLVRSHRRKLLTDLFKPQQQDVQRLVVLLRMAAVLHRSRNHEPLPHISLKVKDQSLIISLPKDWIDTHPLTAADLSNEALYLKAVDLSLEVKTH